MTARSRVDEPTAVNAPQFTEWSRGFVRLALGVAALLLAVGAFLAASLQASRTRVDAAANDELQNLTLNLHRDCFTRPQAAAPVLQSAVQRYATAGDAAGRRRSRRPSSDCSNGNRKRRRCAPPTRPASCASPTARRRSAWPSRCSSPT